MNSKGYTCSLFWKDLTNGVAKHCLFDVWVIYYPKL